MAAFVARTLSQGNLLFESECMPPSPQDGSSISVLMMWGHGGVKSTEGVGTDGPQVYYPVSSL